MKLTVNKELFVNNILTPTSKLCDNLLIEFSEASPSFIKTMSTSADNSVILLAKTECKVTEPFKCVVPDCKTFLRLFTGIEDESVTLHIDNNVISYKQNSFSFKYHLLDESYVVSKKSISEEKIEQLTYDTSFILTKQKLSEIIRYNSIVPEAEKLYFYSEDGNVAAKLGDEQKTNTNEITTEVSKSVEGVPLPCSIPINIQSVLLFSFSSDQIRVSTNHQLKVFKFETPNLSYIVSGLVK